MAEKDSLIPPSHSHAGGRGPTDTSVRAVAIGRIIDRLCRSPGTYAITVTVPTHRRAPWQVNFFRVESLRSGEM
jgi:hypothetical protein